MSTPPSPPPPLSPPPLSPPPLSPPPLSPPPLSPPKRRPTRLTLAVVVIAVGVVWIGQGLGLIRSRSFMTDDPTWAWIGAATALIGLALLVRGLRTRNGGS